MKNNSKNSTDQTISNIFMNQMKQIFILHST